MSVIRKVPWTRQPPDQTPLDLGNSLLQGIWRVYAAQDGAELTQNISTDLLNGASVQPSEEGLAVNTDGSNDVVDIQSDELLFASRTDAFTILWFGRTSDTAGTLASQRDGVTVNWQFFTNTGMAFRMGADTLVFSADSRVSDGNFHMYAVSSVAGSESVQAWIDGDNFDSQTLTDDPTSTLINISIHARWEVYPTTGFQLDGECLYCLIWRRTLSEAEMIYLSENRWRVFQPRTVIIPSAPSVGDFMPASHVMEYVRI